LPSSNSHLSGYGWPRVKAFNQLPLKVLASPLPDQLGRRVVFVSSDHADASATVAALAEHLGFAAIEIARSRKAAA